MNQRHDDGVVQHRVDEGDTNGVIVEMVTDERTLKWSDPNRIAKHIDKVVDERERKRAAA